MNELPFWEDGSVPDTRPNQPIVPQFRFVYKMLAVYRLVFAVILFLMPAVALWFVSPWWMALYLVFVVSIAVETIGRRRKVLSGRERISRVQKAARELTGASQIGSAIHVAGHPALQREQPVVIALIDARIVLYPYEQAVPLDEIPLSRVGSVQTVVYDDERVPHVDVVDATAQALQISFRRGGDEFTCLFRRMGSPRPIDWYHAIQQARSQSSPNH